MTRATEVDQAIRESIRKNLKILVFDEMHTYKGRQGSDVSMLVRRIKAFSSGPLQCIGTSATMASGVGTEDEQRQEVATVAQSLFGSQFQIDQIIGETLTTLTNYDGKLPSKIHLRDALFEEFDVNKPESDLKNNALVIWLENRTVSYTHLTLPTTPYV